jgi:sarcosine oxidase gamma subunit
VIVKGETSLQWMGPDEWLLIVPSGEEFAAEQNCVKPWATCTSRSSTSAAASRCSN